MPTQYRNVTKTVSKKGPLWTNNVVKIKLKYEISTLEHNLKREGKLSLAWAARTELN